MTGDYDDFIKYDKDIEEEILPLAEEFIDVIEKMVRSKEKN
jgi:hypothetical protein